MKDCKPRKTPFLSEDKLEEVGSPPMESSEQVVDIFTKVFCEKTFSNLKSLLGVDDHVVNND